jgi:hypothetical protein
MARPNSTSATHESKRTRKRTRPGKKSSSKRSPVLFEKNRTYYHTHKQELLKQYRGKYIAIWDEQVIGVSENKFELMERVYQQIGNKPVFFTLVTATPTIVRVPSIYV